MVVVRGMGTWRVRMDRDCWSMKGTAEVALGF